LQTESPTVSNEPNRPTEGSTPSVASSGRRPGVGTSVWHHHIERRDHRPDRCTIYTALDGETVEQEWIAAMAGSYASLEEMR